MLKKQAATTPDRETDSCPALDEPELARGQNDLPVGDAFSAQPWTGYSPARPDLCQVIVLEISSSCTTCECVALPWWKSIPENPTKTTCWRMALFRAWPTGTGWLLRLRESPFPWLGPAYLSAQTDAICPANPAPASNRRSGPPDPQGRRTVGSGPCLRPSAGLRRGTAFAGPSAKSRDA